LDRRLDGDPECVRIKVLAFRLVPETVQVIEPLIYGAQRTVIVVMVPGHDLLYLHNQRSPASQRLRWKQTCGMPRLRLQVEPMTGPAKAHASGKAAVQRDRI
jgi:hypothetical protein